MAGTAGQQWWANPYLQAGIGLLSGNQGITGDAAFRNALAGGMSGVLRGQTIASDIAQRQQQQQLAQLQLQQAQRQIAQQQALQAAAPQLVPAILGEDPQARREAWGNILSANPQMLPQILSAQIKQTPTGMFQGTGMTAQDSNLVMQLAPKVQAGTATPDERTAYSMAYQRLQQPTTLTTPEGTYTRPGVQLPSLPRPAGLGAQGAPGFVPGFTPKPPTEGERKAAGQFTRMSTAQQGLMALETDPEFDVTNLKDWIGARMARGESATGTVLGTLFTSPKYQQYSAFAGDWIAGLLRYESGAAVPDSEFHRYFSIYFPLPGEDESTTRLKAQRRAAANSMVQTSAGRAISQESWRKQIDDFTKSIEPNPKIPEMPALPAANQTEKVIPVEY